MLVRRFWTSHVPVHNGMVLVENVRSVQHSIKATIEVNQDRKSIINEYWIICNTLIVLITKGIMENFNRPITEVERELLKFAYCFLPLFPERKGDSYETENQYWQARQIHKHPPKTNWSAPYNSIRNQVT
jgi:hypothetical protein